MTLQITISPEAEAKLRRQAIARGRDAAQYASEIVEREVTERADTAARYRISDAEQQRLRGEIQSLLREAEALAPTLTCPVFDDPKSGFDQIVHEKARKQGLIL